MSLTRWLVPVCFHGVFYKVDVVLYYLSSRWILYLNNSWRWYVGCLWFKAQFFRYYIQLSWCLFFFVFAKAGRTCLLVWHLFSLERCLFREIRHTTPAKGWQRLQQMPQNLLGALSCFSVTCAPSTVTGVVVAVDARETVLGPVSSEIAASKSCWTSFEKSERKVLNSFKGWMVSYGYVPTTPLAFLLPQLEEVLKDRPHKIQSNLWTA